MKKMMLLGVCLLMGAATSYGQESRQDVSISATELMAPDITGQGVHMHSTLTTGVLASYRYMLTPRSALEVNYSFGQNTIKYNQASLGPNQQVHARQQEMTGAYVYSRTYGNFNPFVEVGVGGLIFTPILDSGTTHLDTRQNTNISGLAGAGVAYEISPSFDIRAQYRGFILKTPDFGVAGYKTNRYYWESMPTIGIAYHF